MSQPLITPLLLCGGSGTRLWPLSRKSFPKQFVRFVGDDSLFQSAARRLSGPGFAAPVVISASDYRFIITEQLLEAGIDPAAILIEPAAQNTAPAILAGTLAIHARDPQALVLIAPSDHLIPDTSAFMGALQNGLEAANSGKIITFGIQPDRAETGYGYLEPEEATGDGPRPLCRFVEKPTASAAHEMLTSGKYLWNSGIFLASVQTLIAAFETHAPALLEAVQQAYENATPDLGFLRLAPEPWARAADISIDYAIMEKADNLMVVPFADGWSDLGDWASVWRESAPDRDGVVAYGAATAIECKDTLLRSESVGQEIVGLGLENIIAVSMPDAVLVADTSRAQDVKAVVDSLKAKSIAQAETFPRSHRPWGWFETLTLGPRFHVKQIMVHPGGKLSLQSHHHRAEHWIVVAGTATVTIGDETTLISENQSVYIPLGQKHRLENQGRVDLHMIEVQTGAYLGEDDITRYEDIYARD